MAACYSRSLSSVSVASEASCAASAAAAAGSSSIHATLCYCCPCSNGPNHATNFANVEDMLFEVFCSEESDSIDQVSIGNFLKVSSFISVVCANGAALILENGTAKVRVSCFDS